MTGETDCEDDKVSRCALVTGANKGIGFGLVRKLSKSFKGTVYLTARDQNLAEEAITALFREDLLADYFLLDITNKEQIEQVRDTILQRHGGLDLLVNNAGIGGCQDQSEESVDQAKEIINTNFYGTLQVSETMFPILRPHARVVNMSSDYGSLKNLRNENLKEQLRSDDITIEELRSIIDKYIRVCECGDAAEQGYPTTLGAYSMSKMGVTILSRIQQKLLDGDTSRRDLVVNACTPGEVATEMTHYHGKKTIEEAVEIPFYCATLPVVNDSNDDNPSIPRGQFVRETVAIDWGAERGI